MPSSTAVRLVLKFNFPQILRNAGWSEGYDLSYADLPTAITAGSNINAFMVDRCQCLGQGPVLVEAVLSAFVQPLTPGAPPVRRNSISLSVPTLPPPGDAYNAAFNGSTPYPADFAPTVYYINAQTALSGSPVYRRNIWIAGLPDNSDVTTSGTLVDPPTLTAVNKFMSDLRNTVGGLGGRNGVAIKSIDRSGTNPVKPCTAWNITPNTYTVPAHGFAQGQPILAEGMKTFLGGTCPRGRYLVGSVVDANTITLEGASPPTAPTKLGGFRARIVVFNQIAFAEGQGFTKRDKGRPFGLSVGRRPVPKISRA